MSAMNNFTACDAQALLAATRQEEAMTRAVEANPHLLALKTIYDVLPRAAADLGAEAQTIGESLLRHPAFETTLQRLLKTQMKEATYVYTGDLAEGEAYEGEVLAIEAVGDCSIVNLNAHRISLILDVTAKVRVEVQFEDRDSAAYEREDDRWFGGENASTEVEDLVNVDVWVEVNRASGGSSTPRYSRVRSKYLALRVRLMRPL